MKAISTLLSGLKRLEAWLDADLRRLAWGGIICIFVVPPVMLLVARWSAHHIVFPIMMRTFPEPDPLDAVAYVLNVFIALAAASFVGGICLEIRALWLFLVKRHHQTKVA